MWSKLIERERRQAVRHQVSLHASVIFLGSTEAAGEQPLAALGTTRDLSSQVLTLFVPPFPFSGELTEAQRALKVVLALPFGYVIVWARLIWSREPLPDQPESGYLIAARITELSATDRTLYQEYLQALAAKSSSSARRTLTKRERVAARQCYALFAYAERLCLTPRPA